MDTVDQRATKEWLENLDAVLEGRTIDYLVVSHMEPDHAANAKTLIDKFPNMKIVGNAKTFAMMSQFFDVDLTGRSVVVNSQKRSCFQRTDLENSERLMWKSHGRVKQEDIILIS